MHALRAARSEFSRAFLDLSVRQAPAASRSVVCRGASPFSSTVPFVAAPAPRLFHTSPYVASHGGAAQFRKTDYNDPSIPFKFTPENAEHAAAIVQKFPPQYKKGATIPLLHLAQRQNNGFCSISVMNYVAEYLEMPPMRVYEVATFYTMFNKEPIGKYFLQLCTTSPCVVCGADKVLDAIKSHLKIDVGETTPDGLFTLVEVECAAACTNAPVLAVNEDYYEDLTPEKTVKILDELRAGRIPPRGPQNGRKSAEPLGGQRVLKEIPYGPGHKCTL
ncbi:NADH dehydrogenase flavo protein 2 [Gonapodya prolifera JEL478]|uniref:NADH dehydrogenase flavo protein 2 n=1 Tax=Gonapodya prolifera (strain JEL478) TaxID=1344416 RepID=A0A139B159_GONPJ|nr:NADH dehydrogenase flavo protein 2 [Gonapodya prolifera JEL478]|eukprot:KXS22455.1 NADH dehydrogenase flavo protein 2 [Gonapodya prolifera JEL478]